MQLQSGNQPTGLQCDVTVTLQVHKELRDEEDIEIRREPFNST